MENNQVKAKTEDKLYLLAYREIYGSKFDYDTLYSETRQLDYYRDNKVTAGTCVGAIKQYNASNSNWWLRSPFSNSNGYNLVVNSDGKCSSPASNFLYGVSPAFVIS